MATLNYLIVLKKQASNYDRKLITISEDSTKNKKVTFFVIFLS